MTGELPISACRLCRAAPSDCRCPTSTDEVVIVPDSRAQRIRAYLRSHPELVHEEYQHDDDADPLSSLCYPAAEAYYHSVDDRDLDVYCLSWSDVDDSLDGTHWYLREPDGGRFIDLGLPKPPLESLPPFEQGTRRSFITGWEDPSQRTETVLSALEAME